MQSGLYVYVKFILKACTIECMHAHECLMMLYYCYLKTIIYQLTNTYRLPKKSTVLFFHNARTNCFNEKKRLHSLIR